jgi:hypothetical protein
MFVYLFLYVLVAVFTETEYVLSSDSSAWKYLINANLADEDKVKDLGEDQIFTKEDFCNIFESVLPEFATDRTAEKIKAE